MTNANQPLNDPPPNVVPKNNPQPPLPPQNPPQIQDLIEENLSWLRVVQQTYNTIPSLSPMLATLNTIVANIETLIEQHDAALHWCDEMHY